MKKLGIIIFIVALAIGVSLANFLSFGRQGFDFFSISAHFGGVTGSGNVITETRDIRDFSTLDVSGIFKVEVTVQKDFSVEVQADDNLMPFIKTEVHGGVLQISAEKRLKTNGPIVVRVFAPDVRKIDTSGAANVSVNNVKNDVFGLKSCGASKIFVQGSTSELAVEVSGASNVDAVNLASEKARVNASGASNVTVNVSNELNAEASGASKILYSGNAKNIVKRATGASSVTPK